MDGFAGRPLTIIFYFYAFYSIFSESHQNIFSLDFSYLFFIKVNSPISILSKITQYKILLINNILFFSSDFILWIPLYSYFDYRMKNKPMKYNSVIENLILNFHFEFSKFSDANRTTSIIIRPILEHRCFYGLWHFKSNMLDT